MGTTKIQTISNAFVLLGGSTIASLDEDSTEAKIASSLYDTTYEALLTRHRWRFNTKQVKLAKLSTEPLFGFTNMFQLPIDLLYLIKLETRGADYQIFERKLYSNLSDINIEYQYKSDEFDNPPYFTKVLEYDLASQFSVPLTGDLDKASFYERKTKSELINAKFVDSTQTPTQTFASVSYDTVRY